MILAAFRLCADRFSYTSIQMIHGNSLAERMKVYLACVTLILCVVALPAVAQSSAQHQEIQLPSSKVLLPVPGGPQRTNSFPTAVALSPDGRYLAILNNGYGTAESKFQQSIALLDLANNQLLDFPDPRLAQKAKQSYFLGLAWSSDGGSLYASMGSLTDPEGKKPGDTGNGVAVYRLQSGKLMSDRFLKLPLAPIGRGKKFTYNPKSVSPGYANPYPAGLAVVKRETWRCAVDCGKPG